jgi:TonB family protein
VKTVNYSLINGLLGTIILHLLVGIVFFSAKISGIYNQTAQIVVETPESLRQEIEEQKKKIPTKAEKLNNMADAFISAQQRKNIGVNQSSNDPAASEADLRQIQEDIANAQKQIASVQANLDNQSRLIESNTDEGKAIPSENVKKEKIQGKLAVYKGPTNIYFDLVNRKEVSLYVPVYKCEGNGRVVINVTVNAAGEVEDASINKAGSDFDECLIEAAIDAAQRSRFTVAPANAPQKQKGTITYLFVAQ